MKNKLKMISCTAIGFLAGSLTIVGANQAIQAMQNTEIKISLNGQVQEFKDETTGETQYPITYNNRTYLPLRNVAQLAGLTVIYDKDNNIAELDNKYVNTIKEFFNNIEPIATYKLSDESSKIIYDRNHYNDFYSKLSLYDNNRFFYEDDWQYMGTYTLNDDILELNFEVAQALSDFIFGAQEINVKVILKKQNDSLIVQSSPEFKVHTLNNIDYKFPVILNEERETGFIGLQEDFKLNVLGNNKNEDSYEEKISSYLDKVWLSSVLYKDNISDFNDIKLASKNYLANCAAINAMSKIDGDIYEARVTFNEFNDILVDLFGADVDGLINVSDIENVFFVEKNSDNTYHFNGFDGSLLDGTEYIIDKIEKQDNIYNVTLLEYKYSYDKSILEDALESKQQVYDRNNNLIIEITLKNSKEYDENDNEIISLKDELISKYSDKLSKRIIKLKYDDEKNTFNVLSSNLI